MPFHQLPQRQKDLIRECIVAITQGPFLEEWEFQMRIGHNAPCTAEGVALFSQDAAEAAPSHADVFF